jgi:hypothetical protein
LRRSAVVCTAAIIVMLTGLLAQAVNPTPTPVFVVSNVDHVDPSATTNYLAWLQNTASKPKHYDVRFSLRSGGSSTRVNATGTQGSHVRPIWGTDSIVYQQYTRSTSDIYTYNMATKKRTKLKLNTAAWEYWPAASTKYVLFVRNTRKARVLLLYNRKSGLTNKITSIGLKCACLIPDWVGQHHALYTVCSPKNGACEVKVLTIGGGTKTVPGKGNPYSRYGAAMDESTGDVYYVSSNTWCGLFVELDRWNISGGTPTTIYDFDEGIDGNEVTLAPDLTTPGDVDLYFSDWDCLHNDRDAYMIPSVNTL